MKLSPISVEQALQSAAEATYPVPAPIYGPVENGLRYALGLFGPDGEYWIKNAERKVLETARVEIHAIYSSMTVSFDPSKIPEPIMRCEERLIPERFGYCVVGALKHGPAREGTRMIFLRATGIPNIPEWNDHPARHFSDVKTAFERAISYAHERAL